MNIRFLGTRVDRSTPDVGAVEEDNVGDCRDKTSESHAVRQREGGSQQDRRVLPVGGQVDSKVRVEDTARVVGLSVVVEVLVSAKGKIAVELGASISKTNDSEKHDEDAGRNVGNGKGRGLERREQETRDDGPVERDGQETQSSVSTKDLVNNDVVRGDPAGEHEQLEELSNNLRNPLPAEGSSRDDEEEAVSTNLPAVGHGRIGGRVVVQRVHDSGGDEHSRPDHG